MTDESLTLPVKFGNYYLFDHIGQGGMAEIFLAKTHTELGTERLCVIKRILPALNRDREFCEMLIKEANLCANLSNGNVVQTYELGQIDNQYYIAMEYVEGVDLNRLLGLLTRVQIALPLQFALFIITETLRGLDYAHRLTTIEGVPLGIIHRDVSPTNILISTEGEVKICDFGIAKVQQDELDAAIRHVDEHHLKGKVAYMAPEHVNGQQIDQRADLFAAGILLWELLSGRRLYKTKDEAETLRRAKEADIPPLEDRGFPEFEMLAALVKRALAPDPIHRFSRGQEFIRAVEDYMHVSGMIVSQLRFSDFLMENFGDGLKAQRRDREKHLGALMELMNRDAREKSQATANLREQTDRFTLSLLAEEEDAAAVPSGDPEPTGPLDSATLLAAKFEQEDRPEGQSPPAASPTERRRFPLIPVLLTAAGLLAAAAAAAHFMGLI